MSDDEYSVEEPDLVSRIHGALSEIFAELEDGDVLLNRWVLIVDSVESGGRACHYLASEGTATWEVAGLANAAKTYADTQMSEGFIEHLIGELNGDDDDDD